MKPFKKDFIVDYAIDFPTVNGLMEYVIYKTHILWSVFSQLFLLLCMIVVLSQMFQELVLAMRYNQPYRIKISFSIISKLSCLVFVGEYIEYVVDPKILFPLVAVAVFAHNYSFMV